MCLCVDVCVVVPVVTVLRRICLAMCISTYTSVCMNICYAYKYIVHCCVSYGFAFSMSTYASVMLVRCVLLFVFLGGCWCCFW